MAEIDKLLSGEAKKDMTLYNKFLSKTIGQYKQLNTKITDNAKALDAVGDKAKKVEKTQQNLDGVTREGNKLLGERNSLVARRDKKLEEITKQTIKLKEAEKKRLAVLKEEITGEKKAAEAKKKSTLAAKEKAKAEKAAATETKRLAKESEKAAKENERLAKAEGKAALKAKEQSRAYVKLTSDTNKAEKEFKDLATAHGVNSKQAEKARKKFEQLDNKLRKVNTAAKDGRRDVGRYGKVWGGIGKSIIATTVAFVGFRTVFNVFKNGIKTIATFEESMSKVKAVTGALPKEFKALTNNAKLLGRTTSRTATEVSSLQLVFSKLGFSTKEILQATEATISLSIAAGEDLASAAVVAASTVRGFGLDASETQRVVDVMAKSFASSALDLEKFKTGMAIAAPVAKSFGKDIEFTTARMSVLADAGLDASTAGTSLRNMFLELTKNGLTWDEGLQKINDSTNKAKTGLELFGKRGVTAALILADNIEKAEGLEKAYDGAAGSAEEMARIMEDNLIGDTRKLSSAWEGFILGLNKGDGQISKTFRGLTQWLTDLVSGMNLANETLLELQERFGNQELQRIKKAAKEQNAFQREIFDERIEQLQRFANAGIITLEQAKKREIELIEELEEKEKKIFRNRIDRAILEAKEVVELTESMSEGRGEIAKLLKLEGLERKRYIIKLQEENSLWAELALKYDTAIGLIPLLEEEINDLEEAERKLVTITKTASIEMAILAQEMRNIVEIDDPEFDLDKINKDAKKAADDIGKWNDDRIKKGKEDEKEFNDFLSALVKKRDDENIWLADQDKERRDKDLADAKIAAEAKIALNRKVRDSGIAALQETGNILFDLAQSQRDAELEGLEEGSARRKELLTEQAQSEKNQALFNVAIGTAQGIIKTIASVGLPAAFPLLAIQAAIAGVQIAAIASQPIPEFFKGTTDSPFTFIAGDGPGASTRELIYKQDGSVELSPNSPTLYSGKEYEHATILPNPKTEKMLSGNKTNVNKELVNEMRLTRRAIENSNTSIHFSRNVGKLNRSHFNRKHKKNV